MDSFTVGFALGFLAGIVSIGSLVLLNQKMKLDEWDRRG